MIKTYTVKTTSLLLGFGLLTYVGWLFVQEAVVVSETMTGWNMLALFACLLIALYLVAVLFFRRLVPKKRRELTVAGLVIILLARAFLVDDPSAAIYLSDMMILIGVYLFFAGILKLYVTKKIQQAREDEGVEIIEV